MEPDIDSDAAVQARGQGHYAANLREAWWGYSAAHGGYLACVLLRAMAAELSDAARLPRSLTVHYLRGPDPGEARVDVELVRTGRKLSMLTARMTQQGRPICLAMAAYGVAYSEDAWTDLSMPSAPAPAQVARQEPSRHVPLDHRLELRPCLGEPPFGAASRARFGGWGRLAVPRPVDAYSLTLLADGFWPCFFTLLRDKRQAGAVVTVDLTVHFRSLLPRAGAAPDAYVLVDLHTRTLAEGYLDESARLWSEDGRLLAESSQLAVRISGS